MQHQAEEVSNSIEIAKHLLAVQNEGKINKDLQTDLLEKTIELSKIQQSIPMHIVRLEKLRFQLDALRSKQARAAGDAAGLPANTQYNRSEDGSLRIVRIDDKEITVAPGSRFVLAYTTSAISQSTIKLSQGLTFEDTGSSKPLSLGEPGSSVEHLQQILVAELKCPSIEAITEIDSSPIPGAITHTHVLVVHVQCPDPKGKRAPTFHTIQLLSTGWVYGTKYNVVFKDLGDLFVAFQRGQSDENDITKTFPVDAMPTDPTKWKITDVWTIAEAYFNRGVFRDMTAEEKRPRCPDCGEEFAYYRGKVALPDDVPELWKIVSKVFEKRPDNRKK